MKRQLLYLSIIGTMLASCGGTDANKADSAVNPDKANAENNVDEQMVEEKAPRIISQQVAFESKTGAELTEILGFYIEGKGRVSYQGYYSSGETKDGEVPSGPFKFTSISNDGGGTDYRRVDYKGDFEAGKRQSKWLYRVNEMKDNELQQDFTITIDFAADTCQQSKINGVIHPELSKMDQEFKGSTACDFEAIYAKVNSQWGEKIGKALDNKARKEALNQ